MIHSIVITDRYPLNFYARVEMGGTLAGERKFRWEISAAQNFEAYLDRSNVSVQY
ncbi:hypothetical protein [Scytonema sp. NUACC21]